ncbi:hypothetical protein BC629DRAFT_1726490 [Irpex lacteus]|nr:hypothetical protein BC629DRAFT_1726490 [Irpex lacteus]
MKTMVLFVLLLCRRMLVSIFIFGAASRIGSQDHTGAQGHTRSDGSKSRAVSQARGEDQSRRMYRDTVSRMSCFEGVMNPTPANGLEGRSQCLKTGHRSQSRRSTGSTGLLKRRAGWLDYPTRYWTLGVKTGVGSKSGVGGLASLQLRASYLSSALKADKTETSALLQEHRTAPYVHNTIRILDRVTDLLYNYACSIGDGAEEVHLGEFTRTGQPVTGSAYNRLPSPKTNGVAWTKVNVVLNVSIGQVALRMCHAKRTVVSSTREQANVFAAEIQSLTHNDLDLTQLVWNALIMTFGTLNNT